MAVRAVRRIDALISALAEQHVANIEIMAWYKVDANKANPVHMRTPALEHLVFGAHSFRAGGGELDLPIDPKDRHNLIMGPGVRSLALAADKKPINVCEKPEWLAEALVKGWMPPGSTVLVVGAGSCGDVRGLLNAGMNVVALEGDPRQYAAAVALMNAWLPDDQAQRFRVAPHEFRTFLASRANFSVEVKGPEEERPAEAEACVVCGLPGEAMEKQMFCTTCGKLACGACTKDGQCLNCVDAPLEIHE